VHSFIPRCQLIHGTPNTVQIGADRREPEVHVHTRVRAYFDICVCVFGVF
jgi:hypothetical protein